MSKAYLNVSERSKVSKRYLKVQGLKKVHECQIYPKGTKRFKIHKADLKFQGIQKVSKYPIYPKGTKSLMYTNVSKGARYPKGNLRSRLLLIEARNAHEQKCMQTHTLTAH